MKEAINYHALKTWHFFSREEVVVTPTCTSVVVILVIVIVVLTMACFVFSFKPVGGVVI